MVWSGRTASSLARLIASLRPRPFRGLVARGGSAVLRRRHDLRPGCWYGGRWTSRGAEREQRRAAEAVRGTVCILAGAGSGKTTTITRRIAHQVASGAFRPSEILAVTFTEKAAGVMKSRLAGARRRRCGRAHLPLGRARAAPPLLARLGRADPADEGAAPAADREHACRRRSSSGPPATSRPRSSGRRRSGSARSGTWPRSATTSRRSRPS